MLSNFQGVRMSLATRILVIVLLCSGLTVIAPQPSAHALAPVNDSFTSARTITGSFGSIQLASTDETTKEVGEPLHGGDVGGASVWFQWIAPSSGVFTVDTSLDYQSTLRIGSSYDTTLGVYTGSSVSTLTTKTSVEDNVVGCVKHLSPIAGCQKAAGTFIAAAGVPYFIAVDGYRGARPGPGYGSLVLSWAPTPANDAFPGPTLSGAHGSIPVTLTGATAQPGETLPTSGSGSPGPGQETWRSVWYSWTAPRSGGVDFMATEGPNGAATVRLYTGNSLGTLQPAGGIAEGVTYQLQVVGSSFFTAQLSPRLYWGNDQMSRARSGYTASYTNENATKEAGEPNHAGNAGGASVWYWFSDSVGQEYQLSTAGSSFDTLLAVYTGSMSLVAANDDSRPGVTHSELSFFAASGTTYFIAIDGKDGATGPYVLTGGLAPPPPLHRLDLSVDGAGGVTSSPAGISCGLACWANYEEGTLVSLTALPTTGHVFAGWGGACSGTGSCEVVMGDPMIVSALFLPTYLLSVQQSGTGGGNVSSSPAGIACGTTCGFLFTSDTTVILTGSPDTSSTFTGWSGACTGTGTCQVSMTQARTVTATFALREFAVNVSLGGVGSGSITSSPAGIDCGVDCSEVYDFGTSVSFTPTADSSSTFTGWSGACTGTGTCQVSMTQARTVTASFNLKTHQPDAMVALVSAGPYAGNDIYGSAEVQIKNRRIARGHFRSFFIKIQNDGNSIDRFTVWGPGSSGGFIARYFLGSNDITSRVASGYSLRSLAPGGSAKIRLQVKVRLGATTGTSRTWRVVATSSSDTLKSDFVKARVTIT